jgi:hypothetical protein
VDWLAADQAIRHHDSSGFEVMINDGSRSRTMLEVPGADVKVAVSDRRVVLVHADVDPGASSLTRAADFLLGGNVGTVRDLTRSVTGTFNLRQHYHLLGQVDLRTVVIVRYYQATMFGSRSLLSIWANLGEPAPRQIVGIATSFARKVDVRAIAADVMARAKRAQLEQTVVPLSDEQRTLVQAVQWKPSGDAFIATFPMVVSLRRLSGMAPAPRVVSPEEPSGPAAAGWYQDPAPLTRRFQRRWWDGEEWTIRIDPEDESDLRPASAFLECPGPVERRP